MAFETISWALRQRHLKPSTKLVLVILADHRNKNSGQCNPSQKTLARACEQSVSSINSHLKTLEDRGLIKRVRQFDSGTGAARATQYFFLGAAPEQGGRTRRGRREPVLSDASAPLVDDGDTLSDRLHAASPVAWRQNWKRTSK